MQYIESLELSRLAIHGINNMADEPEIAQKEEVLSEGIRHFFEEHIRNCIKSPSARTAKFNSADTTLSTCAAAIVEKPEDFIEQNKVIGMWFSHQMAKTSQVNTFLAVALFTDLDTDERLLALLKMDPIKAFVKRGNGDKDFEAVQILPDPGRHLMRFAVVRPYDGDSRFDILYRNQRSPQDEDPETAAMWLEGFLEAADVATPKEMTQLVVKETEKWIQMNDGVLQDETAAQLRNAVRTLAQSDEIDIEAIAEQVLPDPDQREQYIGRLLDRGLTETQFTPDRAWAERSARKTTYICDDGVQISGPSDAIDDVVQVLPKGDDRKTRVVIQTRKFQMK